MIKIEWIKLTLLFSSMLYAIKGCLMTYFSSDGSIESGAGRNEDRESEVERNAQPSYK